MRDVAAIQMVWLSQTGLTNLNSGEGGSNLVDIKKYRHNGQEYPYVSGQAMRFYLKEAIRRHLNPGEACVADEQGETCGRIAECVLCDLFGFMTTLPDVGALTRVSPVKVSPATGQIPLHDSMVSDFLTRRHRGVPEVEEGGLRGDIVNVELSTNLYKAGLCVDVRRVGFEEERVQIAERAGKKPKPIFSVELKEHVPSGERARRIKLLLDAIKDFSDYSKQARLLTDFTPDLVLIALQENYSHRLQKALEVELTDGGVHLNVERLKQVLQEVQEELAEIDKRLALWAGMLDGVVANIDEVRRALEGAKVPILTPREAIGAAEQALGV
jgi:CRISPR-associated protein Cst2